MQYYIFYIISKFRNIAIPERVDWAMRYWYFQPNEQLTSNFMILKNKMQYVRILYRPGLYYISIKMQRITLPLGEALQKIGFWYFDTA